MDSRSADVSLRVFAQSFEHGASQKSNEIEVKFGTDPSGLKRALDSPLVISASALQTQNLRSIYFDSPSGDLRKNGIVLRIRKKGRTATVLGVKSASITVDSLFLRNEIEVRSRDLEPNLALFDENTAAKLTGIIGDRPLELQFETQVKRRTAIVNCGRSQVEVAFDDGCIVAGELRVPLTEVELELKWGDEADLYDLAIRLAEELPLHLDFVSKGEKGFRTCGKESAAPVKAESIQLKSGTTFDGAVTAVLSNTLAQFVANWAALRETEHPESIHQMRVALRRMRSGLAMFKKVLPCPEFDVLRAEAKRIASALGPARECDAFRNTAEQGPLSHADRPAIYETLLAAVEDRRIAAYRDARALIEDRGTTLFVLKVQSFLARGAWRNGLPGVELHQPTLSAKKFAKHSLVKLSARVLKRGKGLPNISDEARHKLRIALKNLRYGAEFFGGLFDRPRKMKSYIDCVSELQDLLGAQNDVVMARHFLDKLSQNFGPGAERASGFLIDWYAHGVSTADENLCSSWKKFKRTDAFWD